MNVVSRVLVVFRTSHLVPSIAVTTVTAMVAYVSGQRDQILLLILAILLGQLSVSWCNDYLDRERDRQSKRKDKPIVTGDVSESTIKYLAMIAFVTSIVLSSLYGTASGIVHIIALASAYSYNFKLKRTIFSILPFFVSFSLLPVFVTQGSSTPYFPAYWMMLASGLLAAGIHFQNVIPDFKDDARTGVKGFPHYFSFRHAVLGGSLLLMLSALCSILGTWNDATSVPRIVAGGFAITSLGFAILYIKRDTENALKLSMLMTLVCAALLVASSPYM